MFTEVVYQLLSLRLNPDEVLEYVTDGDIKICPIFSNPDSQRRIRQIVKTYNDLPADFADAWLVTLYEQNSQKAQIMTVDSDFTIYRTRNGADLSLISPYS